MLHEEPVQPQRRRCGGVARAQVARRAQVAQVTVRHTVIATGPCRLGDPDG